LGRFEVDFTTTTVQCCLTKEVIKMSDGEFKDKPISAVYIEDWDRFLMLRHKTDGQIYL